MKYFVFVLVTFLSFSSIAAETNTQKIIRVQYDAKDGHLYFVGEGKWSSPGCTDATYVWGKPDLLGLQQLLSIGLAAHMSGKEVRFSGKCDSDTEYFEANYIVVLNS